MTYEDVQYEDEQEIVDTFGKFFSSVYLKPDKLDIDFEKRISLSIIIMS